MGHEPSPEERDEATHHREANEATHHHEKSQEAGLEKSSEAVHAKTPRTPAVHETTPAADHEPSLEKSPEERLEKSPEERLEKNLDSERHEASRAVRKQVSPEATHEVKTLCATVAKSTVLCLFLPRTGGCNRADCSRRTRSTPSTKNLCLSSTAAGSSTGPQSPRL